LSRSQARTDAFLELLQPLQRPLEIYCRRMLRNRSLVEDVIQSALAAAYARFDPGMEAAGFKPWIYRFVTLEVFNRNRKHEPIVDGELVSDTPGHESECGAAAEAAYAALLDDPDAVLEYFDEVVACALVQLAPYERVVILLRSIGGFSYAEIQELLSIPLGSVMGYLARARKRLRTALADYATQRGLIRKTL